MSYYSSHNSSKKIIFQAKWSMIQKDKLWQHIIKNKILNQALLLRKIDSSNSDLLLEYMQKVTVGDTTNREGHAAKVYFNSLFGKDFARHNNDTANAALNYGYAILLSTFTKEIICKGYITQLGIHHKNEFNDFNLACDLMESFRPIIDNFVYFNRERDFGSEYKMDLVNIFNHKYNYHEKKYTLKDIIRLYVNDIFEVIENDKAYQVFSIYEG